MAVCVQDIAVSFAFETPGGRGGAVDNPRVAGKSPNGKHWSSWETMGNSTIHGGRGKLYGKYGKINEHHLYT